MTNRFSEFWDDAHEDIRRYFGFHEPTDEDAEKAYQDAESLPLSGELIDSIIKCAVSGTVQSRPVDADLSWIEEIDLENMTNEMELVLHRNRGALDKETIRRLKELREKAFKNDDEAMAEGTGEEKPREEGGPTGKPDS